MNKTTRNIIIAFVLAVVIIIIFYVGARQYTPIATIAIVIAFAGFMRTRHDVSQAERFGRTIVQEEEKEEISESSPRHVIDASFSPKRNEKEENDDSASN